MNSQLFFNFLFANGNDCRVEAMTTRVVSNIQFSLCYEHTSMGFENLAIFVGTVCVHRFSYNFQSRNCPSTGENQPSKPVSGTWTCEGPVLTQNEVDDAIRHGNINPMSMTAKN